jgi:replicative DNA helicase
VASASVAWAVAAARQGLPTALWARRLTEQCVADHLLALEAGVGLRALREGALTEAEWSAVAVAQEGVTALPLLVAGGAYNIKVGDLLRNLRRWQCDAARVRVVVVDGAEHLDVEPRTLFRTARMMEVINRGYLVVVGNEGHAAEEFADLVLDERQWAMSGASLTAGGR